MSKKPYAKPTMTIHTDLSELKGKAYDINPMDLKTGDEVWAYIFQESNFLQVDDLPIRKQTPIQGVMKMDTADPVGYFIPYEPGTKTPKHSCAFHSPSRHYALTEDAAWYGYEQMANAVIQKQEKYLHDLQTAFLSSQNNKNTKDISGE